MMRPKLVLISGPSRDSTFEVTEPGLHIGRDAGNDISLNDPRMSRSHFTVLLENERSILVDHDSQNGVYVNGFCFDTKVLVHGDRIQAGGSRFVYLEREDVDENLAKLIDEHRIELTERDTRYYAFRAAEREVLGAFLKMNASINTLRSADEIQARVFELIFEIIPAERVAILLTGHDQNRFVSAAYRRIGSEDGDPFQLDESIAERVLHEGEPVLDQDSGVTCWPITAFDTKVGVIYVVAPTTETFFFRFGYSSLLESIAGSTAIALEHARYVGWIEGENQRLNEAVNTEHGMIGRGERMQEIYRLIGKAGPSDRTVLILGASGTGKELVAQAIHRNSPRAAQPFVPVNCGAFTETLLESELFGHEKGSFTGAASLRKGLFEVADGGTIFLDEIGDLAMPMQVALLRVLQEGEFRRVGGNRSVHVNVRVVAATNRNLEQAVHDGSFRGDLFFRLNVLPIEMPSLSERREDIPVLAAYFIKKYGYIRTSEMPPVLGITPEAHDLLAAYAWPGNIRELEHAMEHAISFGASEYIRPEDLPKPIRTQNSGTSVIGTYDAEFDAWRKSFFERTLETTGGNRQQAAEKLDLHPTYFAYLCRALKVKAP